MRNAERFFIGVAWLMGITMIAIGAAHLVFLNPDLRPADGRDMGYMPLIGDLPILWMVLGWELPTAALVLGGLVYHRRMPGAGAAAATLGALSYAVHLWYFVPVLILTGPVIAAVVLRTRRLVTHRSAAW